MKYTLTFNYQSGNARKYEADEYFFQSGGVVLQKKHDYNTTILRTDEKLITFKFINLEKIESVDIQEKG
jgi:hypothetical protein